jgi:hypothetical protein
MGTPGDEVVSDAGLWLYVRCDEHLFAIAAEPIERALLVDEAPPPQLALGVPTGCLGLLEAHGARYVAWDLGQLLGLAPSRRAWILLHVPHVDGPQALALRTDDCLHVGLFPHAEAIAIATGVIRTRPAFPRAFPTSAVRALHGAAAVGFELDLARLWTDDERARTHDLHQPADGGARSEHV